MREPEVSHCRNFFNFFARLGFSVFFFFPRSLSIFLTLRLLYTNTRINSPPPSSSFSSVLPGRSPAPTTAAA